LPDCAEAAGPARVASILHSLVGCDGGRSLIRKTAGIDFVGWALATWFGPAMRDDLARAAEVS
jgi:2-polyprenyl-6-methoxyphenol hydroxylase-like FAD-dependent oxidoreductase